jgi:hypothetical protein
VSNANQPQDYREAFKVISGHVSAYGDPAQVDERNRRERRAARTTAQRSRRATRTAVINVRVEPKLKRLVARLAQSEVGKSMADIIHDAVRHYAAHKDVEGDKG